MSLFTSQSVVELVSQMEIITISTTTSIGSKPIRVTIYQCRRGPVEYRLSLHQQVGAPVSHIHFDSLLRFISQMGSLTPVGYVWALLSLSAALLCCSGCYLPYWIQGRLLGKVDAYFNSFRRCNYPKVSPQGAVEIVMQCARYSRWKDIPSGWWQASTVLVAVACVLSIVVAVMAVSACCLAYVIHTATARLAGTLQLVAGLLMCGGVAVYPLGLDNREVRDCCGVTAHVYNLGTCKVSWSAYLLAGAVTLLLVCCALHPCVARDC